MGNPEPVLYRVLNMKDIQTILQYDYLIVGAEDKRDSLKIMNNLNKEVEVKHFEDTRLIPGIEAFKKIKGT